MFSTSPKSDRELGSSDPGEVVDLLDALICGRAPGGLLVLEHSAGGYSGLVAV